VPAGSLIKRRGFSPAIWRNWLPRPKVDTWAWVQEHIRAPNGAPFDADSFPWCREVCEAFDNPRYREIDLQWASRLAKTFISQSITLCQMANNPMPAIFASSREKLAVRMVKRKLYPMLERCAALADQLKPAARRSMYSIDLREMHLLVSWSGSDSTLADAAAYFLHCNEVDKWSTDASSEADPVELAAERVKEFPDHKMIFESTPALAVGSRIEPKLLLSTNGRYYVPCPRCSHHQILKIHGDDEGPGGIFWEDMSPDPAVALRTARYVCESCAGDIHDEQRARMMRAGRWVPEGQTIDKAGRLHGTPRRDSEAWGGQLSSFYSLQLRWGRIASAYVKCLGRPRRMQNFINSWRGCTFAPQGSTSTPEQLGQRHKTDISQGIVPAWAAFLTAAVDCQEGFFVYQVLAWGPKERGHLVDYGICDSFDEVLTVLNAKYAKQGDTFQRDGVEWTENKPRDPNQQELGIPLTLVDSSAYTKDVYRFCKTHSRKGRLIIPCKGANTDMGGEAYQKKIIGVGKRGGRKVSRAGLVAQGLMRIHINVDYWEREIQKALDSPSLLGFCAEASIDMGLCEQLLNGAPMDRVNARNITEQVWIKKDEETPNDHRDTLRMARVAAELLTRGQWSGLQTRQPAAEAAQSSGSRRVGRDAQPAAARKFINRQLPRRRG